MKILTFSASPRKIWVDEIKHILNPSYWLLGALLKRLSYDETVYTIIESMNPVGRVLPYKGQPIDKIVIMGVAYSPSKITSSFKRGYPRHQRAFDIAEKVYPVYKKYSPEVVELTVDVRRWYKEATDCFGFEPDRVITEQEMQWQQVGYLVTKTLSKNNNLKRLNRFGFSGNAKNRYEKMRDYMEKLPINGVIDGGGWDKHLGHINHLELRGFQPYYKSANMMLSSCYGLALHEPLGEKAGWITAKFFENLGCNLINFTDLDYDKNELVLPLGHPLRVSNGTDLKEKIISQSYEDWLKEQRKLEKQEWLDFEGFYYLPFRERLLNDTN